MGCIGSKSARQAQKPSKTLTPKPSFHEPVAEQETPREAKYREVRAEIIAQKESTPCHVWDPPGTATAAVRVFVDLERCWLCRRTPALPVCQTCRLTGVCVRP